MEPLHPGQPVTYFDSAGSAYAATVLEAYSQQALIGVPDLGLSLVAPRLRFEEGTQAYPYFTDADGGSTTEASFEAPIAEE